MFVIVFTFVTVFFLNLKIPHSVKFSAHILQKCQNYHFIRSSFIFPISVSLIVSFK